MEATLETGEMTAESAPVSARARRRAAQVAAGGKRPKAQKSRITNGSTLLPTASGCSVWARLVRDTLGNLMAHLGGVEMVSETQKLACRRVSVLEAELIYIEDTIATARQEDREPDPAMLDLYGRLADRQRRLADPLGWHRAPRDVTPTLAEIVAEIHAEEAAKREGDAA